jgi:hypothetical protein
MSFSTLARKVLVLSLLCFPFFLASHAWAQDTATLNGTVTDNSGAVIPGAKVALRNAVSGLARNAVTGDSGGFVFHNLPYGNYTVTVQSKGFATSKQIIGLPSAVPVNLNIAMKVGAAAQTVTVQGAAPLTTDTSLRTSMDRTAFSKIPLENPSSALSSLVTMMAPGVAADSNGMMHGLGDHAENSYSIDGQPVTDQQSKIFSNQLPEQAVQSIQVISGAPPAEYGDKTSLVIIVHTRSGEGITTPTGSATSSYGSFGTAIGGFNISYGGKNWGNFLLVNGQNSGRFLDTPEHAIMHDKGNEESAYDRIDYQFDPKNSMHLDLEYSRSWFQTPNTYDNLNVRNIVSGGATADPVFADVGNADQRSKIGTFNIAPTWTRIVSNNAVLNIGVYIRRDGFNYYPSNNPLADLGPPNLQQQSVAQQRSLLNAGLHSDLTWTHGVHTVKIGGDYNQTFLNENFQLGIVNNLFDAPCVNAGGSPVYGYSSPSDCPAADSANPAYNPALAPYDLTRGGTSYRFNGHTDVKLLGVYAEDEIKTGNWFFNIGLRGDVYNGLTDASQAEPRISMAYTIQRTHTVLRASYARTLETPFNENLVLSSEGCANPVLNPLLACASSFATPLAPGYRNAFHAGLEQHFGNHIDFSADYIWKYTHNAYDFSVLGNTPITFPIEWHNSKIPGFAGRIDVVNFRHLLAYTVFSSVAARFFPPQVGGAGATVGQTGLPFRIDHDEHFNQSTHIQYSLPFKTSPWIGFNWRYDSGLVAGAVPCYNPLSNDPNSACASTSTTLNGEPAVDLSGLTADQEFEAGLSCNGVKASPGNPLPAICPANELNSSLVKIPAPGTGDNDHNPPRVRPRSVFDLTLGDDNLFVHGNTHLSMQLTGINIANKYALYNFLSTFSGTHYLTPRSLTAQIDFHF